MTNDKTNQKFPIFDSGNMQMTMKYDFDTIIPRRGTNSYKWDIPEEEGTLPMWVADMDFRTAPAIIEALRERYRIIVRKNTPYVIPYLMRDLQLNQDSIKTDKKKYFHIIEKSAYIYINLTT